MNFGNFQQNEGQTIHKWNLLYETYALTMLANISEK